MGEWERKFIEDMNELTFLSAVFARIVEFEFDGTVASVNSPKSLVRNAMITRWHVYGELGQSAWEEDLRSSDFYSAAFTTTMI